MRSGEDPLKALGISVVNIFCSKIQFPPPFHACYGIVHIDDNIRYTYLQTTGYCPQTYDKALPSLVDLS